MHLTCTASELPASCFQLFRVVAVVFDQCCWLLQLLWIVNCIVVKNWWELMTIDVHCWCTLMTFCWWLSPKHALQRTDGSLNYVKVFFARSGQHFKHGMIHWNIGSDSTHENGMKQWHIITNRQCIAGYAKDTPYYYCQR